MSGRVVLITGGSRGIGAACARRFARGGDRVALLARPSAELETVAAELDALAVGCDLTDAVAIEGAVARVHAALGSIEVLVNNAGLAARHPTPGHPVELWDEVQAVNLRAPFLLARAVLPEMLAASGGRIVNVSSISGRLGTARMAAYCSSKWGLIGLTKALSEEVKGHGVVVTALCPGSVDTRMLVGSGFTPDMSPEDVAEAVWFLAGAPPAVAGAALDMFG